MRRAVQAGVVGVLCWVAPAEAASVPCGPPGARTLKETGESRAFAQGERIYACVKGSRARRLGTRYDPEDCVTVCDGVARIALAGRFVAWNVTSSYTHGEDPGFVLETLDLRSGRVRMRAAFGDALEEDAVLSRIVITRSGATAWTYRHTRGPLGQEPSGVAIERDPRCGRPVVDDGRDVKPGSLRLRGNRLVWRTGGATRTTRFCNRRSTPLPVCGPRARTVTATRTSRLWTRDDQLWGCTRGKSRMRLGDAATEPKLAHRAAAFARVQPSGFSIVSVDLERRTQRVAGAGDARLLQLEVDTRGRVAYLSERDRERTLMRDTTCSPQLVDHGPGLEPLFLLVGIDTLWWTVGTETKSAPLC